MTGRNQPRHLACLPQGQRTAPGAEAAGWTERQVVPPSTLLECRVEQSSANSSRSRSRRADSTAGEQRAGGELGDRRTEQPVDQGLGHADSTQTSSSGWKCLRLRRTSSSRTRSKRSTSSRTAAAAPVRASRPRAWSILVRRSPRHGGPRGGGGRGCGRRACGRHRSRRARRARRRRRLDRCRAAPLCRPARGADSSSRRLPLHHLAGNDEARRPGGRQDRVGRRQNRVDVTEADGLSAETPRPGRSLARPSGWRPTGVTADGRRRGAPPDDRYRQRRSAARRVRGGLRGTFRQTVDRRQRDRNGTHPDVGLGARALARCNAAADSRLGSGPSVSASERGLRAPGPGRDLVLDRGSSSPDRNHAKEVADGWRRRARTMGRDEGCTIAGEAVEQPTHGRLGRRSSGVATYSSVRLQVASRTASATAASFPISRSMADTPALSRPALSQLERRGVMVDAEQLQVHGGCPHEPCTLSHGAGSAASPGRTRRDVGCGRRRPIPAEVDQPIRRAAGAHEALGLAGLCDDDLPDLSAPPTTTSCTRARRKTMVLVRRVTEAGQPRRFGPSVARHVVGAPGVRGGRSAVRARLPCRH